MNDSTAALPRRPSHWTRRTWLGGGLIVAGATAAAGWRAVETGMILLGDEAFDPWHHWRDTPAADPLSLVAAAVLASNPHNMQPWLFRVAPGRIDVRADPARNLGAFDPFGREKTHGLGAAIANIEIAAPARGFASETLLLPDAGDAALAARIALRVQPPQAAPLADALDRRHTNRAAYDPQRRVPAEVLDAIAALDDAQVRTLWLPARSDAGRLFAHHTLEGTAQISADAQMAADGHHWFRANPKLVQRHRDGVATATAGISPIVARLSPLAPPVDAAAAGRYWLRSTESQLASAPMFGLVLVRDLYDRRTQLLAGARWQRIHLMLTQAGLAAHPMNQLMELVDRDRQLGRPSPTAQRLADLGGGADWRATFAFRTGYATRKVPASARRPVQAVTLP